MNDMLNVFSFSSARSPFYAYRISVEGSILPH